MNKILPEALPLTMKTEKGVVVLLQPDDSGYAQRVVISPPHFEEVIRFLQQAAQEGAKRGQG